ncbi:histidine phosphotransferase family protein [Shimia aestuarii]|uniref:histidine phosphotransferase family protein n=1 Tax=Shimia aestuarii TaxID=254406 RepID=UPI001FB4F75A|nr:histidine phosphotransferase family protein [Shimia aestuarii]
MPNPNTDLAALVGSRICHDLISPVGAIGNGLELITMSGDATGPEIGLISGSVSNATARIRFFRIAFGLASGNQLVPELEIRTILADSYHESRISLDWLVEGAVARPELRAVFLALLCAETALGRGGVLSILRQASGIWQVVALSDTLTLKESSWQAIETGLPPEGLTPNEVEFGLLPCVIETLQRRLAVTREEDRITLSF